MSLVSEVIARSCVVTGRVQGVGFRWWAKQVAEELGIAGWVRNSADGRVELMVQGSEDLVDVFVAKLAGGPPMAAVEDVRLVEAVPELALSEFSIRG